jgi:uncharacterized membrane-anchored protein YhcB (DUF1043 family)
MEAASWFSVASMVFLVIGVAIGVAAGHFFSPAIGEARRLKADLDRIQHEHDSYRSSVNSHFRKTADLVGQMTKSYAAVYDHLAGGARRFCDESGSDAAIPFEPLPGALASPVIETAADASAEVASPNLRNAYAEDDSLQDIAAADDAAPELTAEEYTSDESAAALDASDRYPAEDYAAEEYAADDYKVAGSDEAAEEEPEAPRARA